MGTRTVGAIAATALALGWATGAGAQQGGATGMTFFVTSVGSGNGADLGGLAGADAHCQELAAAVGCRRHVAGLSQHAGGGRAAGGRTRAIGSAAGRGRMRRAS